MRKHYKLILIHIAFVLFLLPSCKQNTDEINPSNTALLVNEEWHGHAIMANNMDVSARPEVRNLLPDIKTLIINFKTDGTYTATHKDQNGERSTNGKWEIINEGKTLRLDLMGEVQIKTLTNSNLNLITSVPLNSMVVNAEVQFVRH